MLNVPPFTEKRSNEMLVIIMMMLAMFSQSIKPTYAVPVPPTGISAFHRDGQTFLTWNEVTGSDVRYNVYRSTAQITSLAGLSPLGDVDQSSTRDRRGSQVEQSGTRWFAIQPNTPLPDSRGLFVHTTALADQFYYAVTSYDGSGENTTLTLGSNSLSSGVNELVGIPTPVLQRTITINSQPVEIYVHWVSDFSTTLTPAMANIPSLPFHFSLARRGSINPHSLIFRPHARGGSYYNSVSGSGNPEEWILVLDDEITDTTRNTFWFGYHEDLQRGVGGLSPAPDTGLVMDYTARRMDWTLDWALAHLPLDSNRVYMMGGSMGALGSVFYALRQPERIAAIWGTVPKFDFSFLNDPNPANVYNTGGSERRVADRLWGTVATNLQTNSGVRVYERLNAGTMAKRMAAIDLPPLMMFNGKQDVVVGWAEKIHSYSDYDSAKQLAVFFFDQRGHGGSGGAQAWAPAQDADGWLYQFRRNLSFPAFSECSANDDPGDGHMESGDSIGTLNGHLAFNSIVDADSLWQVTVTRRDLPSMWGTVTAPESISVDVTPRRLQSFDISPSQTFLWSNARVSDNVIVQTGMAVPDSNNLLTVTQFLVIGTGNRLTIMHDDSLRVDDLTIHHVGDAVMLRWSPKPSALSYSIYGSETPEFVNSLLLGVTSSTTFSYATPADRYFFCVIASDQIP
jgi:pimeloyl-ACP methyl ester carboxylesterase